MMRLVAEALGDRLIQPRGVQTQQLDRFGDFCKKPGKTGAKSGGEHGIGSICPPPNRSGKAAFGPNHLRGALQLFESCGFLPLEVLVLEFC